MCSKLLLKTSPHTGPVPMARVYYVQNSHDEAFRSVAMMSGRSLMSVVSFELTSTRRTASRWSDPTDKGSSFSSVE